jgi:hypothetical protein
MSDTQGEKDEADPILLPLLQDPMSLHIVATDVVKPNEAVTAQSDEAENDETEEPIVHASEELDAA